MIIENCNLEKILLSGQSYNIKKVEDIRYIVKCGNRSVECLQLADDIMVRCSQEEESFWCKYFDVGYDYKNFWDKGIHDENTFIVKAFTYAKGIRLLCNDYWECAMKILFDEYLEDPKRCFEDFCINYGSYYGFYSFPNASRVFKESSHNFVGVMDNSELIERIKVLSEFFSLIMNQIDFVSCMKLPTGNYEKQFNYLTSFCKLSGKEADRLILYATKDKDVFPRECSEVDYVISKIGEDEWLRLKGKFSGEIGLLWLVIYYFRCRKFV